MNKNRFMFLLLALAMLTSCGSQQTDGEKKLEEGLNALLETAKESEKELKELENGIDTEQLKKVAEGLTKLTKESITADNKDKLQHFEYGADALWKAAVQKFQEGATLMPIEGLQREFVGRVSGDKKGETEAILWGKFLYKDSVFALLPRKVSNKGEVKEVEGYEKLANTSARDLNTKGWIANYTLDPYCILAVLQHTMQSKIGVLPTSETETVEGVETKVYNVSLTNHKQDVLHGKVYIDPNAESAVKVEFIVKNKSAAGGSSYTLGVHSSGATVVTKYKVTVKINMLGLAESSRITTYEFTEHGDVTIE